MSVVYVPPVPRYVVEVNWPREEEKWSPHQAFHTLTEAEEAADKAACRSPEVLWRVVDTQPEPKPEPEAQEEAEPEGEGGAVGGTVYIDVIPRFTSLQALRDLLARLDEPRTNLEK